MLAEITTTYLELSYWQVGLAALLVLINGAISVALRLEMERSLAVAAVRTVGQLLLIGLVLEWVFRVEDWRTVLILCCLMTAVAGLTAVQRSKRRYPGLWLDTLVSVWVSSCLF